MVSTRFTPAAGENKLFAGAHLPGVPVRSFGRLVKRTDDAVEFVYKPWLVLAPRVVVVPGAARTLSVGSGAIFSDIVDAEDRTLFTLPPRYHGHEEQVAQIYGFKDVHPIGLSKAWSELREMLGGRAVKA